MTSKRPSKQKGIYIKKYLNVDLLDDIIDGNMKHPFIQSDNLHCAACQSFPERNLGSVDQIDSLSAETRMGLVFYNKYDVSCKQKCGFCRQTEEHLYGEHVFVFRPKSPNSEFF